MPQTQQQGPEPSFRVFVSGSCSSALGTHRSVNSDRAAPCAGFRVLFPQARPPAAARPSVPRSWEWVRAGGRAGAAALELGSRRGRKRVPRPFSLGCSGTAELVRGHQAPAKRFRSGHLFWSFPPLFPPGCFLAKHPPAKGTGCASFCHGI